MLPSSGEMHGNEKAATVAGAGFVSFGEHGGGAAKPRKIPYTASPLARVLQTATRARFKLKTARA